MELFGKRLKLLVATFLWFTFHLQFTTLDNLDLLSGSVIAALGNILNLLDDIVALKDFAKDNVHSIEPAEKTYVSARFRPKLNVEYLRSGNSGNEELGSVGVPAGIGHA